MARTGFSDDHADVGVAGAAARRGRASQRRRPSDRSGRAGHRRRARTGRGDRRATARRTASASPPAMCWSTSSTATVDALGDAGVIAVPLDVTSADQWALGGARGRRPVRLADHAGQQRRCAAPGLAGRRDAGRLRRQLAGQLSRPVPRHPGRAGASARRPTARRSSTPAAPERSGRSRTTPRTARRSGHCEASPRSPPPSSRRRESGSTRCSPDPSRRPMLDEATQARLAAHAPCRAESASRRRSPTRWRSWYPSTRRSSPVPNSSSTADRSCRSDDGAMAEDALSVGIIGAGPGGLALGIFLRKAGFRRLHHLRPRGRRRRHLADQHLSGSGLRREVAPVLVLVRPERELVAAVVGAARDPRVLRTVRAALPARRRT